MTQTAPVRSIAHGDIKGDTAEAWIDRLIRSVAEPVQDGLSLPGFPPAEVQRQFVGSAYELALGEAANFYRFAQEHMAARAYVDSAGARYLDFGCGWGRIGRFFLRDFEAGDMAGVDIDPEMVGFCKTADLPGHYAFIANGRPLPFASGGFKLITAYSVFTHLPPALFRFWLQELLRLLAPDGLLVFTVEPPRFLDFLDAADPNSDNAWQAALSAYKDEIPRLRRDLAQDGVAYLATGGGAYRESAVYGDTVVTPRFIDQQAAGRGEVVAYVDDPDRFWQAAVVVRRASGPITRLLNRLRRPAA